MKKRGILKGMVFLFFGLSLSTNLTVGAYPSMLSGTLSTLKPSHPRLIASSGAFITLKLRIPEDPDLRSWYEMVRQQAESILHEPVSQYQPGGRLLEVSRRVLWRVYRLAFLYRLDGNPEYAERAWRELQAAADFNDWNPDYFLDTAEMTHAFAIGYDWLFGYWTRERREILKNALVEKGLKPAWDFYQRKTGWVTGAGTNWNLVCNGGIGLGALAIADEAPELAEAVIQASLHSLPYSLTGYAPNGGWDEGLGYWHYGTHYFTLYLAALESSLGRDFGLSATPGFDKTALFPVYLTGTNLSFNFGDSGTERAAGEELFWLAERFNLPEAAWWQRQNAAKGPSPLDLLWYKPEHCRAPQVTGLALDHYFQKVEVATFRSSWDGPSIFAGLKGRNSGLLNQADLDQGSFVLESSGVRWAEELGADSYNLPGYFDFANWRRWTFYRKMSEGQNTLVINPASGPEQDPAAASEMVGFISRPDRSGAVVDLSKAYQRQAVMVRRGLFLIENRRRVLLQDELKLKRPGQVWWFMHTQARIQLLKDGRTALLRQGDETLWVRVLEPSRAKLRVLAARPLPKSPNPAGQNPNSGYRKLTVQIDGVQQLRLAVLLVPLRKGQSAPVKLPKVVALNQLISDR